MKGWTWKGQGWLKAAVVALLLPSLVASCCHKFALHWGDKPKSHCCHLGLSLATLAHSWPVPCHRKDWGRKGPNGSLPSKEQVCPSPPAPWTIEMQEHLAHISTGGAEGLLNLKKVPGPAGGEGRASHLSPYPPALPGPSLRFKGPSSPQLISRPFQLLIKQVGRKKYGTLGLKDGSFTSIPSKKAHF